MLGRLARLSMSNTAKRYLSTAVKIQPISSALNVNPSLHPPAEQEIFRKFANRSIEENIVILHTCARGTCEYGYAASFTGNVLAYLKYNKIKHELDELPQLSPLPMQKTPFFLIWII